MSSNHNNKNQHQNIFEIADTAIYRLYAARKMFVILILTTMVFPPVLLGSVIIFVDDTGVNSRDSKLDFLIEQLKNDVISLEQFAQKFKDTQTSPGYNRDLPPSSYLHVIMISIFVFWICYGIKKWITYGKLGKRYTISKASRIKSNDKQESEHTSSHTNNGKRLDEEIFEIVNNTLHHLNHEKKMTFLMIAVSATIPFILSGGLYVIVVEPVHAPLTDRAQLLMAQLENNEISKDGFIQEYESIRYSMIIGNGDLGPVLYILALMLSFSIFWLGYGIRQWYIFTKWSKKFRESIIEDEEINKKLSDG